MIISRTPFRVSFFGGGTDYPEWYKKYGGEVVAASIDKYCYITCRHLPPFFDHKFRIVYSKIELAKEIDEIQHPVVKEVLKYLSIDGGLDIHYDGDIPARSGIGSSSSFTVGLLNAITSFNNLNLSKYQLSTKSIYIERELTMDCVGCQDQITAAFGGLNHIVFTKNGEFIVNPVSLSESRICDFENHLMLFFTGFSRLSSEQAKKIIENISEKHMALSKIRQFVGEALSIINSKTDLKFIGELLHESWMYKRSLSNVMSNVLIDEIYTEARLAGALGGKIIGAGGGGFLLLFVRPRDRLAVKNRLKNLIHVPFRFDLEGSQILYCDQKAKRYNNDGEN
ncbi:MAG: kinase [Oligoflexia bacterium]|nr:kinase [Oligoflexia bacterium]